MNYLFTEIMQILKCTERGQITLPKKWRDQVGTSHFLIIINEDELTLKPLKEKTLQQDLEEGWERYKSGEYVTHEEMKKKHGL